MIAGIFDRTGPIISALDGSIFIFFHDTMEHRIFKRLCHILCYRKFPAQIFCLLGDIHRLILIHLDHGVRNMEKCSRTPGNQNGRNIHLFIEFPCSCQKWRDRLLIRTNNLLHKSIPHHKIRCRGIFIQQKQLTACLDSFYDSCRLGCTAAGVFCRKIMGIPAIWQIIDKHRDIYIFDESSIFSTQFERRIICNDILSAIACNMIVDTKFQSI